MKRYLLLGVLAVLFAIPLSAAEKVKIKLPDGVFMYDSSVQQLKDGSDRVGFRKFIVVENNIIYSSKEAIRYFGILKLNRLFGGNKKYKILLNGEVIGTKYNLRFDKEEGVKDADAVFNCDESYIKKNIKEGPMYGVPSIYLERLGSAVNYIGVPEEYKEQPRKVFNTISQEEINKISKLAKDKLFNLVKNRKEIKQHKLKDTELYKEKLELLDKISHNNDEMYIGIYRYVFKIVDDSRKLLVASVIPSFEIVFSVKKDNIYVITSDNDEETLYGGNLKIQGMLDVDGCGEEELVIEKEYPSEDETTTTLEIYKQKVDGNWIRINKNKIWRKL